MTEIERAIESAEVRLRNAEYLLSISHGSDDTIARKRNKVEVCRVTLDALTEQAARSTGCEYCTQGEEMAYGVDTLKRTAHIYLDGNLLTADLYSDLMAVAVCYCPMCGRKLKEDV